MNPAHLAALCIQWTLLSGASLYAVEVNGEVLRVEPRPPVCWESDFRDIVRLRARDAQGREIAVSEVLAMPQKPCVLVADMDCDGEVGLPDYAILRRQWACSLLDLNDTESPCRALPYVAVQWN